MMSLKLMLFLQSTMTWKCDMMKYFWPIGNVQFVFSFLSSCWPYNVSLCNLSAARQCLFQLELLLIPTPNKL